jgi:uncharacterized membrane protein
MLLSENPATRRRQLGAILLVIDLVLIALVVGTLGWLLVSLGVMNNGEAAIFMTGCVVIAVGIAFRRTHGE